MLEEIINSTRNTKECKKLFDFNKINNLSGLNYINYIESRESFRLFGKNKKSLSKEQLYRIISGIQNIIDDISAIPFLVQVGIIDNKVHLDSNSNESKIYIFENNEFKKISLTKKIDERTLFLQYEMHDSDVVIFFLWDFNLVPIEFKVNDNYYKEIIMTSGFLGQIAIENSIIEGAQGTVFAGIIAADWPSIVSDDNYKLKTPIFAYAMEKN
ncbi:hypothetical protein [Streptococcus sobrinus]|uniref:hypothetical protein n=1 Tax=Streptococcus sobrinus TaxID=1310 RepID=UPI0002F7B6C2|nr:hypothetical protein [Streptococcus sobrinus]